MEALFVSIGAILGCFLMGVGYYAGRNTRYEDQGRKADPILPLSRTTSIPEQDPAKPSRAAERIRELVEGGVMLTPDPELDFDPEVDD